MKNNKTLEAKYESFSDEKLVQILTKNRNSYTAEALVYAKNELEKRNIDLTILDDYNATDAEEMDSNPIKLDLPDQNLIFLNENQNEDLDYNDRLNNLVDGIENSEKEISELLKEKYSTLSDNDLLQHYTNIITSILDKENFGENFEETSIDHYQLIQNEIETRAIDIPSDHQEKHFKVLRLLYSSLFKKHKKKGKIQLTIAIISLFFVLLFVAFQIVRLSIFIFLILGGKLLVSGIKHKNLSKEYRKRLLEIN